MRHLYFMRIETVPRSRKRCGSSTILLWRPSKESKASCLQWFAIFCARPLPPTNYPKWCPLLLKVSAEWKCSSCCSYYFRSECLASVLPAFFIRHGGNDIRVRYGTYTAFMTTYIKQEHIQVSYKLPNLLKLISRSVRSLSVCHWRSFTVELDDVYVHSCKNVRRVNSTCIFFLNFLSTNGYGCLMQMVEISFSIQL